MTRTQIFIWVIAIAFGLLFAFSLFLTTAVCMLCLILPDTSPPPLTAEQQRLIEDLREGKFSKLEDIKPAPGYVCGPEEIWDPHPQARHYLKYYLPKGQNLMVVLDEDLRLIEYSFHGS